MIERDVVVKYNNDTCCLTLVYDSGNSWEFSPVTQEIFDSINSGSSILVSLMSVVRRNSIVGKRGIDRRVK